MRALYPTPHDRMVDRHGRPYFLWDMDITLERFAQMLDEGNDETWCYLVGKLMRQAKPDDVFQFVTTAQIRARWEGIQRYLGRKRELWRWLLDAWGAEGDG